MKKIATLLLDRSDIRPGFQEYDFYSISPYVFTEKVQEKMRRYPVTLFIDDDERTRVIQNDYGKFGFVVPVNKVKHQFI